jgi:hypothetical protein
MFICVVFMIFMYIKQLYFWLSSQLVFCLFDFIAVDLTGRKSQGGIGIKKTIKNRFVFLYKELRNEFFIAQDYLTYCADGVNQPLNASSSLGTWTSGIEAHKTASFFSVSVSRHKAGDFMDERILQRVVINIERRKSIHAR